MSSATPTTTEPPPRKAALGRSFTVPAKSGAAGRGSQPGAEIGATGGLETLFIHPNGKVIKFTANAQSRSGSRTGVSSPGEAQQGTLPWATVTEKTMAAGPLEIYRVPGSVSFLHSGSLLHAILPRSNCWCVDGVSKFALRVLPDTYYRIELPGDTPEDMEKVQEFKVTLQKVLFYEKTACPFARTFTVDLPEEHETQPGRQKSRRRTNGPAKKWRLEKAYSWKPEGWTPDLDEPSGDESSESQPASDVEQVGSVSSDDQEELVSQVKNLSVVPIKKPTVEERAQGINLRSVTAPPQVLLQSTPPSTLRSSFAAADTESNVIPSASQDRRTLHAAATDVPPSPPDSSTGFDMTFSGCSSRAALPEAGTSPREQSTNNLSSHEPEASLSCNSSRALGSNVQGLSELSAEFPDESQKSAAETNRDSEVDCAPPPPRVLLEEDSRHACSGDERCVNAHVATGIAKHAPASQAVDHTNQIASLSASQEAEDSSKQDNDLSASPARSVNIVQVASSPVDDTQHSSVARAQVAAGEPETGDPFAAIQARIQARRSIGGTTSFVSTARDSSSASTASSASLGSNLSRRSQGKQPQQDQALATALVTKACSTFLGPPAHLVLIMLKIAARFAKGIFPKALLFESPAGTPRRVPGSFDLDDSDIEDFADSEDDQEDDFGVPLRGPIRLASCASVPRAASDLSVKERKEWVIWP